MTRKQLLIGLIVLGAFIILVRPEILGVLFALVFLGLIPGTTYSLPVWVMFIIYAVGLFVVIRWLALQSMHATSPKTARATARKRVMKKTQKKTAARKTVRRVRRAA